MKVKLEKKLYGLIHSLEEIQAEAQAFEERYEIQLQGAIQTSTSADSTSSTI